MQLEQAERMARQRERLKEFGSKAGSNWTQSNDPEITRLAQVKPPGMATYLHLLPEVIADAKAHNVGNYRSRAEFSYANYTLGNALVFAVSRSTVRLSFKRRDA
jgi:hypothetical protein